MKTKAIIGIIAAALFAVQLPMAALADTVYPVTDNDGKIDITLPGGDSGEKSFIRFENGSKATVTGDVNNQLAATIIALGSGTDISIDGSINNASDGSAVSAGRYLEMSLPGARVTANGASNRSVGHFTVDADGENTEVIINGSVSNRDTSFSIGAITARNGAYVFAESASGGMQTVNSNYSAIVKIEGSIENIGDTNGQVAVFVSSDGKVEAGSVSCATGVGILAVDSGIVLVDGAVTATDGIKIDDIIAGKGDVKVAINGELTVSGKAIAADSAVNPDNAEIYLYGVSSNGNKDSFDVSGFDKGEINYIIHGKGGKNNYSNMLIEGTLGSVTINGKNYITSKEGSITVTVDEGYILFTRSTIISVDGNVYIVSVPEGGHVTLMALRSTPNSSGGASWTAEPSEYGSEENPLTNGTWINNNGKYSYLVNNEPLRNAAAWIRYTASANTVCTGRFYFDKNGIMQTGWQLINGNMYYFNEEAGDRQGAMLMNCMTPDGSVVGADGARVQ